MKCPTPYKTAYPSPQKAYAAEQAHPDQERYRCTCGQWHLTARARTHDMAKSSKAGYRDRWKARKVRQKLFGGTGKNRVQGT